jgi:glycopeptide antibiotics resistance protein
MDNMQLLILFAPPLVLLWRMLTVYLAGKRGYRTTIGHETGLVVFLVFLAVLASKTILPKNGIMESDVVNINLIPFKVFNIAYRDYVYNHSLDYFFMDLVGNIAIFIPVGLFIPLLYRASWKKTLLAGFSMSLFIEICQLPLSRWTDVDDLWLNTLGTLLGYILYAAAVRLFPAIADKCRMSRTTPG